MPWVSAGFDIMLECVPLSPETFVDCSADSFSPAFAQSSSYACAF